MTVFTLNVHHHGATGKPVPLIVQRIAFGWIAKCLFMHTGYYHSINEHVDFFYKKEHGTKDDTEERIHKAWIHKRLDYSKLPPVTSGRSPTMQRTSAPVVFPHNKKEPHSVSYNPILEATVSDNLQTSILQQRHPYTEWTCQKWREFIDQTPKPHISHH
jgi:hypothetical protein